jgi:hypothetical protein
VYGNISFKALENTDLIRGQRRVCVAGINNPVSLFTRRHYLSGYPGCGVDSILSCTRVHGSYDSKTLRVGTQPCHGILKLEWILPVLSIVVGTNCSYPGYGLDSSNRGHRSMTRLLANPLSEHEPL